MSSSRPIATDDGTYALEYRDGGPDAHFKYRTTDIGLVADVMWGWVTRGLELAYCCCMDSAGDRRQTADDQDSWRPNSGTSYVDENSDRELGFDDTDGEPFLAYHAGNPDNEKDAEGRLIPIGWVLHDQTRSSSRPKCWTSTDVDEAVAKAKDYLGAPTDIAPRYVSLRNEHRDDGSWLNLDASLGDDGSLRISGQDLGPVTRTISPDGEYEYFYTVAAEDVPALVVALGGQPGTDVIDLLTQRCSGDDLLPTRARNSVQRSHVPLLQLPLMRFSQIADSPTPPACS